MFTTNKARLLRVVRQLKKETADMSTNFYVFECVFCKCYAIRFQPFWSL